MPASFERHRKRLRGSLLALGCALLAGSARAADGLEPADPGDPALRQQLLIERLHRGTRALEIHAATDTLAGAVGAARTFDLATARRTPPQRLIELMAAHQLRYSQPSDAYVRAAMQLAWNAHDAQRAPVSTLDRLLAYAIDRNFAVLEAGGLACCTCGSSSTCTNGIFCDGAETCSASVCQSGAPPCVDGNPCTTDSCNEGGGSCIFSPVPPPNEVANLALRRNPPASSIANLTWLTVSAADAYNVYRGAQPNLSGLACYGPGITGTTLDDDGTAPGLYLYLVSATACGESSLGSGSLGPRPLPPGCP